MKCSRKAGTIKDFRKLSPDFWFSKWTFRPKSFDDFWGWGVKGCLEKGYFFMKTNFNDAGFFSPCVICQMYDFLIKDQAQLNFSPRLCSRRGGSSVAWGRFLLEPTSEIFKLFFLQIVF